MYFSLKNSFFILSLGTLAVGVAQGMDPVKNTLNSEAATIRDGLKACASHKVKLEKELAQVQLQQSDLKRQIEEISANIKTIRGLIDANRKLFQEKMLSEEDRKEIAAEMKELNKGLLDNSRNRTLYQEELAGLELKEKYIKSSLRDCDENKKMFRVQFEELKKDRRTIQEQREREKAEALAAAAALEKSKAGNSTKKDDPVDADKDVPVLENPLTATATTAIAQSSSGTMQKVESKVELKQKSFWERLSGSTLARVGLFGGIAVVIGICTYKALSRK